VRAAVLPAFEAPLVVEDVELLPPGPRGVVVRADAVEAVGTVLAAAADRELLTAVLLPSA
jgi:Zn-dependent alcohol dehydrogenase